MKKKLLALTLTITTTLGLFAGCGNKVSKEPLSDLPYVTNSYEVPSDEEIENNKKLYRQYWDDLFVVVLNEENTIDTTEFRNYLGLSDIQDLKNEDVQEKHKDFIRNAETYRTIQTKLMTTEENEVVKELITVVKGFLNEVYGLEKGNTSYVENPEIVTNMQKYLEENKIEITELVMPDVIISADSTNSPVIVNYNYVVKGTQDGESFEKEFTHQFALLVEEGTFKKLLQQDESEDTFCVMDVSQK